MKGVIMAGKRSEAQPILDKRDPGIHLPEHVSAQSVRFAETWRSTSLPLQRRLRKAPVTIYRPGCEPVVVTAKLKTPKVVLAPTVAATDVPVVVAPTVDRAPVVAQARREMIARDRALRIRRALESGPIARLVRSGAMDADRAYTLASALHDAGKLPGMSDHTGSARK